MNERLKGSEAAHGAENEWDKLKELARSEAAEENDHALYDALTAKYPETMSVQEEMRRRQNLERGKKALTSQD